MWNFCKVEKNFTTFSVLGPFWHKIYTIFENLSLIFYKYAMPHYYFQMIKSSKGRKNKFEGRTLATPVLDLRLS